MTAVRCGTAAPPVSPQKTSSLNKRVLGMTMRGLNDNFTGMDSVGWWNGRSGGCPRDVCVVLSEGIGIYVVIVGSDYQLLWAYPH